MEFERRLNCKSAEWQMVDTSIILTTIDNADLELMIWHKQTITVGPYQYRRHIPAEVIDWAVISGEKQKFITAEVSA